MCGTSCGGGTTGSLRSRDLELMILLLVVLILGGFRVGGGWSIFVDLVRESMF